MLSRPAKIQFLVNVQKPMKIESQALYIESMQMFCLKPCMLFEAELCALETSKMFSVSKTPLKLNHMP